MSLARAIYSRATVLLLDDIISAVDAETSQHIIQHCFKSPLMAGRTVIIASHAVETLAQLANQAIFLENGRAVWQGSGHELLETEYMAHLKSDPMVMNEKVGMTTPANKTPQQSEQMSTAETFEVKEATSKTPKQLVIEEERSKGVVEFSLWWDLLALGGGHTFWCMLVILLVVHLLAPVAHRKVLE